MGNLTFAGTNGPPLQRAVSGWMESEQNISQGGMLIIEGRGEVTDYDSSPDPKVDTTCTVPITVVAIQPPSTDSNGSLAEHSLCSDPARNSMKSALSDYRVYKHEGWVQDHSEESFHSRDQWDSLPLLVSFDDLTAGFQKNFPKPSGPGKGGNGEHATAKATSKILQPSIPRPIISRIRSASQSEASVALKSLHIDFEVGCQAAENYLRVENKCHMRNHSTSMTSICARKRSQPNLKNVPVELPEGRISPTCQMPNEIRKRQVYLCVIFLKIGEIDTIKEQYAADVLIKAKWRDADMDAAGSLEYDWLHNWTPKLYIENTIGETREQLHQMIALNEFGHAFLVEKRRVSGVFLENLELNHFPFDVQDLTITVASNLPSSEIRLLNDPDEPHRINKQSFVDEQEWYLYKHIDSEQHELANEYIENASVRPALSVKCRAARRPAYFIWNIFLVTFLICSLSLVTFAVDRSQPQSRLQLTFTLVLTLVAFKFVVNQCLPKISYLTYLDKYIISSLFFLTIICIWHGGIAVIEKVAERFGILLWADTELYVILLIGIGYFTFNVGFILMIYCVVS
ncbi:hypothetical protein AAHC03_04528 [Spirometra sp. Aus1]